MPQPTQGDTGIIKRPGWSLPADSRDDGQTDHPGQKTLEKKDDVKAFQLKKRLVVLADRLVAPVLRLAVVANRDVKRQAERPDADQADQQTWCVGR